MTPPIGTHGFAPALTSFVGREGETQKVADLLEEYRLVTVTGPGGVGKTRLACEVARRTADRFADGAWLVELGPVTDPALVPAAVAASLELPQGTGQPVTDIMVTVLARQQVLLILDNCEHVLDAVAELCGSLLATADDLRMLATSREPLRLVGETRYRLRPLLVGADPPEGDGGAVLLFADRARQADPEFKLDGRTEPLVRHLVARLDGMPLAIELAAARVEALGLDQLADWPVGQLDQLAAGRGAPRRHRSLTATVDWSYRLLSPDHQRAFRRLAIFPGPFTLDAAATVTGPGAEPAVLNLVDCSLISPPVTGPDGRSRYRMLETLRAVGLELPGGADERPAIADLVRHCRQIATQAAEGLQTSAGEQAAARWLDAEDATMLRALAWSCEHDPDGALRLAIALSGWWHLRGRSAECHTWLTAALRAAEPGQADLGIARFWLGQAAAYTGDTEAALGHFTAACDALAGLPSSPELAEALAARAFTLMNLDRIPEGTSEASRALDLARELAHLGGQAAALLALVHAAFLIGDYPAAVRRARQACQLNPQAIPGYVARECSIALTTSLTGAGEVVAARESCLRTLALASDIGDLNAEVVSTILLTELDRRCGQLPGAWIQLAAALRLALRIGDRIALHDCLSLGGDLCAAAGQWAETVTVWAADKEFMQDTGLAESPRTMQREETLRTAEHSLGSERMRSAQARGSAMTLETAAEFLLLLTASDLQLQPKPGGAPELASLSPREQELVTLVAQGQTDAQIAAKLYISVSTVRSHLDRIRDKTGCRRRADLTRLALQAGLA